MLDARYLITGVAGFIGSHLAERILAMGKVVVGVDNLSTGCRENLEGFKHRAHFTFIEGDVRDLQTCRELCRGATFVLHQAALGSVPRSLEDPLKTHENNVTGTLNVLIAASQARVRRCVVASSSSVHGMLSPYAASKDAVEGYSRAFFEAFSVPVIALRYFNVFGPRQNPRGPYAAVIPRFIGATLRGEAPLIYGDGEQQRDFTYVANVVNANLLACRAPKKALGKSYDIGTGAPTSVNALLSLIEAQQPGKQPQEPLRIAERRGDVRYSCADVGEAWRFLGYRAAVKLAEGIADTFAWYRSAISLTSATSCG